MTTGTRDRTGKRRSTRSLGAARLHNPCKPEQFKFITTDELKPLKDVVGQDRAVEAVRLASSIRLRGYNMFVLGPQGSGRHSFVKQHLMQLARTQKAGSDWCYVSNFNDQRRPRALEMSAGMGRAFKADIDNLIDEAHTAIPAAFEGKDYRRRREEIQQQLEERQAELLEQVHKHAFERGIGIIITPKGIIFAPIRDHSPLSPQDFARLSDKERDRVERESEIIGEEFGEALEAIPELIRDVQAEVRNLDREIAILAAGSLVNELIEKYASFPSLVSHLKDVQNDIIENVDLFLAQKESWQKDTGQDMVLQPGETPARRRYGVNVIVSNDDGDGAPVIFEDQPTHPKLLGQVEYVSQMGTLVTNFNLIKAGALHRANGGYLVLDVQNLLTAPFAWQALKQALRNGQIRIESLGAAYGLAQTASLEPEPVPLDCKIVLIGSRWIYYLLQAVDPEFQDLFKMAGEFDDRMGRDSKTVRKFARLLGAIAAREEMKPLTPTAVARLVEESSRLAGHGQRLSGNVRHVADLMREAHHYAVEEGVPSVTADEIGRAIVASERRVGRLKERVQEAILEDTLAIDTDGETAGQVNCLAVSQIGDYTFARPSRITARVSVGSGKVVDIEREVKLGGPVHSKGVLILQGYILGKYVSDQPLSMAASIVMEQTYSGVEGDSASAAELCALLSSLAEMPVRQGLAVTGSVNQRGMVQAVGAVNQKIEGFFEICEARGLTGNQGVIIPSANIRHLMLRENVRQAVADGEFQIYAVRTVDDVLELLTGLSAGKRGKSGAFPKDSMNGRIEARLIELAKRRRAFMGKTVEKPDQAA